MGKSIFKNIPLFLIFLIFNSFLAQQNSVKTIEIGKKQDTIRKNDSIPAKEQLDGVVKTKADVERNSFSTKQTFLEKKAQVIYQDMQIDADYIRIDWSNSKIYARGGLDEKGRVKEPAIATQAGKKFEYDEVIYDYKTRQAVAFNARTEESEGVIVAQKTKKYSDSVFFMRNGKYTTDTYFIQKKDTIADYYLLAPNIKLVKGKESSQVITGPIQMYIEQVPTPLVMPFAILPFSEKRSAGILIPSFGERQDVGFFLNGLGYYQPIGEHFDLKILSDLYTKGSWNLRPEMNYLKKYRYSGRFNAEIGTIIHGIKGLDDYSKSSTYKIGWTHQQDSKANPLFTFNAAVDITSQKFYSNLLNNNYIYNNENLKTSQTSRVSIQKRFLSLPITINANATYSQNFATGLTDIRLPDLTVAMSQFYLFKPKTGMRTGLLENMTVNTGLSMTNYVQTTEEDLFKDKMWKDMKTGLRNNIVLSTNTSIAKYLTFTLSANVDNVLTTKTMEKHYNVLTDKVDNITKNQFAGFSTFSTSASLQTVLYKFLNFKKGSTIEAIRHMVTPSVSFNYTPDFAAKNWGYYREFYGSRGELTKYSIFEGGIYGSPSSGLSQSIGFNIANNLEMKVKSKSDSTGVKKLKIFENLNISGNYNFAADKNKWSVISVTSQSSFFNSKLTVNTMLTLEPYKILYDATGNNGVRTEDFGHFSLQGFNVQMAYSLSDAIFGDKEDYAKLYKKKGEIRNEDYYFDDDNYARFKQPWNLSISANYNYSKGLTMFGNKSASATISGDIKLTPFWSITGSTSYDLVNKDIAQTRIGFSRDQRSFTINFNWVPFGIYKVYDFFIGIKANILSDAIKYKERSFTQSRSSF